MISFQTYVGSAYSSHPVRWIETPEAARAGYALDKTSEKPVEKVADPDQGKPKSESGDVLDLSPETQKALETGKSDSKIKAGESKTAEGKSDTEKPGKSAAEPTEKLASGKELTPEEKLQVEELQARDQEVRIHEMAHVMAGGAYVTGGPSYEYQVGPDGKGYAVGGSVGIDTSSIAGDPEATIQKMQTVAAAALAPAKPSGQDHNVAAAARQAEATAKAELAKQQTEQPEQSEEEGAAVSAFSIVRTADGVAKAASGAKASDAASIENLVSQARASAFTPGSAYKAQSTMTLASPGFSAFA